MTPDGRTDPTDRRARRLDRRAIGYERDGLAPLLLRLQHQALVLLDLGPDDRLLDVGCATGAAVRAAAPQTALAIGVDRSAAMIRQARQLAGPTRADAFLIADAEALPFPTAAFTAVLCTSVTHYLDNPDPALAEMARVLIPGGRLVIGDFQPGEAAPQPRGRSAHPCSYVVDRSLRTPTPFGPYLIKLARRAT